MNIQEEMDRIFKMRKKELDQNFLDGERISSEEEERNLYCQCGELKTKCLDRYAHLSGGA